MASKSVASVRPPNFIRNLGFSSRPMDVQSVSRSFDGGHSIKCCAQPPCQYEGDVVDNDTNCLLHPRPPTAKSFHSLPYPTLSLILKTPSVDPPRKAAPGLLRQRECRIMSHDRLPSLDPPSPSQTDPMAPGKRRPIPPAIPAIDPSQRQKPPQESRESRSTRRKRLLLYSIAFLTMLGLSAVLDVRRATVRERHPKLQLTLPSGSSLTSINHPQSQPDPPAPQKSSPSISLRPFGLSNRSPPPDQNQHTPAAPLKPPTAAAAAPPASDSEVPKKDPVLSEQELKDDVDQLIAHVDEQDRQEADASKSAAHNVSDSSLLTSDIVASVAQNSTEGAPVEPLASDSTSAPTNSTESVRLNSEEHFSSAQSRVKALLEDEATKELIDENDLRTLEALALQATRGDCEQKSGAKGGSLFKTDAEAASNVDIERTDPLWGAWCLFMGSYKTDAMRDYVTKQRVLEEKIAAAKLAAETNSTDASATTSFDPNAPSLDDVLTPEQQSDLRLQTDRIMGHLQEYDIRYLAALSLQATFGDCGPYGKEATSSKESDEKRELRILREPLLEQTVTRREGAQWGAWCVLQGKKRTTAAAELSQRLDLLVEQLAKSQAAPEVAMEESTETNEEAGSSDSKEKSASAKRVT